MLCPRPGTLRGPCTAVPLSPHPPAPHPWSLAYPFSRTCPLFSASGYSSSAPPPRHVATLACLSLNLCHHKAHETATTLFSDWTRRKSRLRLLGGLWQTPSYVMSWTRGQHILRRVFQLSLGRRYTPATPLAHLLCVEWPAGTATERSRVEGGCWVCGSLHASDIKAGALSSVPVCGGG